MTDSRLNALSPLDGRYAEKCADLAALFSEAALIGHRVRVEAAWFRQLTKTGRFPALARLAEAVDSRLETLARGHRRGRASRRVKELERQTNHDVKAVEYYVREQLAAAGATPAQLEFVHFACTSEDINNLRYALMLRRGARARPAAGDRGSRRPSRGACCAARGDCRCSSRTHGQAASPTTLGKEVANFAARLRALRREFAAARRDPRQVQRRGRQLQCPRRGVILRSTGARESRRLIGGLGLSPNEHTTQIEPHDWIAEYCDALARANTILVDLCRDAWGYVSLGYFAQKAVAGEIGSSTMPHKVNPIAFENAEGNAGLANAMLRHFSDKLPVSRWQRDLTDSTVMRNLGVAFAHMRCLRGVRRSRVSRASSRMLPASLRISTRTGKCLRRRSRPCCARTESPAAYEKLKEFTRGRGIGAAGAALVRRDARPAGRSATPAREADAMRRTPASPRRSPARPLSRPPWRSGQLECVLTDLGRGSPRPRAHSPRSLHPGAGNPRI